MEKYILNSDVPSPCCGSEWGFYVAVVVSLWASERMCCRAMNSVPAAGRGLHRGRTSRPWHRQRNAEDPPERVLGCLPNNPDSREGHLLRGKHLGAVSRDGVVMAEQLAPGLLQRVLCRTGREPKSELNPYTLSAVLPGYLGPQSPPRPRPQPWTPGLVSPLVSGLPHDSLSDTLTGIVNGSPCQKSNGQKSLSNVLQ